MDSYKNIIKNGVDLFEKQRILNFTVFLDLILHTRKIKKLCFLSSCVF